MELLMYLENDLIDLLPIDQSKITLPGYIRNFTRGLKEKHSGILTLASKEPEFIIYDYSKTKQGMTS